MMDYYVMGTYGSLWGFGLIFMIVFWIAIILLIVWIVQQFTRGKETPLEILKKRYARGEISKHEFEDMKKKLR